jgi:hypothetical protein
LALASLAGCGEDALSDDLGAVAGSEPGDGDKTEDGDGDALVFKAGPARGDIALTRVVVNQGVDVAIADAGAWIGPSERNTYIVGYRDTLVRGFWSIPDDWVPRKITARLELRYADGTTRVLEDTKLVAAASFAGDLGRSFVFPLVADTVAPGLRFHMSLWEAESGAEDQRESSGVIATPSDGPQLIGVQSEPAELHIVMLPVAFNDGGCQTNTGSALTAEDEQNFVDAFHEQYPVQDVFLEFRRDTPIVWNQPLTSLAQLWQPLQDQRIADKAAPNVYYYALVDTCSNGVNGAAGVAPGLAADSKAAAYQRVSSGVWLPAQRSYSYHTMVHELGHNHGRAHVYCNGGGAAGTDPTYPHSDGVIGVWGFGIRWFELHSPTSERDFMSYCQPSWVSDWGWTKAFDRIRTLTSWDYSGAPAGEQPSDPGEVLIGLLLENGEQRWWTTSGGHELAHFGSGETIEFDYGDQILAAPTHVQILDDGTTMITAPVPRPGVAFAAADHVSAGSRQAIQPTRWRHD